MENDLNIKKCNFQSIKELVVLAKKERTIVGEIQKKCHWWGVFNNDGDAVACGCVAEFPKNEARLRSLFVRKEYRGKGLSTKLLDIRFYWIKSNHYSMVTAKLTDQPHRKWYKVRDFQFLTEKNNIVDVRKII